MVDAALAADGEHGRVDVGDGHADVGVVVVDVGVGEVAEGYVACATSDVEDVLRWRGRGGRVGAWVEGGDVVVSVWRWEMVSLVGFFAHVASRAKV